MTGMISSYRLVKDLAVESPFATPRPALLSGAAVLAYMQHLAAAEDTEVGWVLPLDMRRYLLSAGPIVVARGGRVEMLVDPPKVFQAVVYHNAPGFLFVHNHPGGVATPSPGDNALTKALVRGADTLHLAFHDHVIVGVGEQYYSYAEHRKL